MNELIRIGSSDSVAVALRPLKAGESVPVTGAGVTAEIHEDIPMGHKVSLKDIAKGEAVIKYGFPIGEATSEIKKGFHVHTNNMRTLLSGAKEYTYSPTNPVSEKLPERFFKGYLRKDGRVGVRNELWIIPTVGCVNDIAETLERKAQSLVGNHVENVRAFVHPYGCSQLGEDQEHTRQVLANFVTHPNAGGVLLLGLGCENSGIEEIKKHMKDYDPERVRFLIAQDVEDEIESGFALLKELAERMNHDSRADCPVSKLVVGLKCGGSDGLSGITANPTIGGFSDLLLLTEAVRF